MSEITSANALQMDYMKFPILQKKVFEPIFCDGQILRGCHSEEEDIYVGEPPSILIPIESDAEIRVWIISILKDKDSTLTGFKYYRLSDLKEISNNDGNEGVIKISLSNEKCIGKNPGGGFTVRCKNDCQHIDKWFSFYVVPYLKVEFNKDIYLPCEEDTPQVYLTLYGPEKMEFEPRNPAKIIDYKDGLYRIETTSSEHSIHGTFRYPSAKNDLISIPISIEIPRLTWRLDGLSNNEYSAESNKIEEIWFGDLERTEESLSLIVSMPPFIHGQGQLSLRNLKQRSEAKITEGKARFDLLRFSDTLKAKVEPIQTFELTVSNSEISVANVELFKVRTRWEIEDIQCIQSTSEGKIKLRIFWKKEYGKTEGQRIVRLWRVWEPDSDPFTRQIPEGDYNIEISEEQVKLFPGSYRIHIDVEDSWSATKPSIPPRNSLNTIDIQIQEKILQGRINITSVIDKDGRTYRLNDSYSIHIEGKIINGTLPNPDKEIIVKPINEGWYVGNVSVVRKAGVNPFKKTNPLKLEVVSNQVIRTAEDRDGDCVCFCTICRMLFWSKETYQNEKKKGHDNRNDMLVANFILKFKLDREGE